MNTKIDQQSADNIRALAVAMVEKANSGHPGGPMGGADFMHIKRKMLLILDNGVQLLLGIQKLMLQEVSKTHLDL